MRSSTHCPIFHDLIMSHLAEEDGLHQSHPVRDQRERAAAARLIKFAGVGEMILPIDVAATQTSPHSARFKLLAT